MDFKEELNKNVNKEFELPNLVKMADIENLDVPQNLKNIKERIKNILNFRNEHQDYNPNCNELMDVMIDLNNGLSKEQKEKNPNIESCHKLTLGFNVLYDNVINQSLLGNGYANKDSGLYKLFENVKNNMEEPERINLETKEYLKVLAGTNYYQREMLKNSNEVVYPNNSEKEVINDSDNYDIPESLEAITEEIKNDINNPDRMKEIDKSI